jgi:hypothetical protein
LAWSNRARAHWPPTTSARRRWWQAAGASGADVDLELQQQRDVQQQAPVPAASAASEPAIVSQPMPLNRLPGRGRAKAILTGQCCPAARPAVAIRSAVAMRVSALRASTASGVCA